MKASVVKSVGGVFQTEDVQIDQPKGYEVLVNIKASGLCHSDLHIRDANYGFPFPAVLGHEPAGIVEAVGELVSEFEVGDHVVGCLIQYCGACEECLSGQTYFCKHPEFTLRKAGESSRLKNKENNLLNQGFGLGGFAEKILTHQNQLAKVPKEMPFDKACLLGCGTVTGAGAIINTAKTKAGDSVAIIGVGGVGLNAISGAKIAGATIIIAIDIDDEKLEFSKKFGATHIINSKNEDVVARVKQISEGGVNSAFEVIGLQSTSEQAVQMIKRGGGAYLIGMSKPNTLISVKSFEEMVADGKKLIGVMMGSSNLKRDIPMYAKLYLEGRMNLDDLVYKTINIDQVEEAYQELASGKIVGRTVITSF
ncbi:zinc-binding dehydrogenase [Pedobacter nanyangensis]|uniref:zinc-binding dehydrogenase n=1 Tax=Pedobacter nanyangensis TaxID=1562389 RepID=UPI000DE1CE29|nr:zinc-binding dehydrogenase [Pedobacter nanyangensis]